MPTDTRHARHATSGAQRAGGASWGAPPTTPFQLHCVMSTQAEREVRSMTESEFIANLESIGAVRIVCSHPLAEPGEATMHCICCGHAAPLAWAQRVFAEGEDMSCFE